MTTASADLASLAIRIIRAAKVLHERRIEKDLANDIYCQAIQTHIRAQEELATLIEEAAKMGDDFDRMIT